MNLDELKQDWKQSHNMLFDQDVVNLVSQMQTKAKDFDRAIFRRDMIEASAALVVIIGFGYFLAVGNYPWEASIGLWVIIFGAIEIIAVMTWTRRCDRQHHHELTLSEFCEGELIRVDRQIRLIRNVNWWYSGPILLGIIIFMFGFILSLSGMSVTIKSITLVLTCVMSLALGWVIYRINQQAVVDYYLPKREEFVAIGDSLQEEI